MGGEDELEEEGGGGGGKKQLNLQVTMHFSRRASYSIAALFCAHVVIIYEGSTTTAAEKWRIKRAAAFKPPVLVG